MPLLSTHKLPAYARLVRLNRPIGTLLVMWPALWSLWLAAGGMPDLKNLLIFIAGAFVMRSAGCAINDYADRDFDGKVERTRERPLATGEITGKEALAVFGLLVAIAFLLVLATNQRTVLLALLGLVIASAYPFLKRVTHWPQLGLGIAFAWPVPMAFSAQAEEIPPAAWLLFFATALWIVVYDTFYAMVDRNDDLVAGIKSTAILFGPADTVICGLVQVSFLLLLIIVGRQFGCGAWYYLGLLAAGALFAAQQARLRSRQREACFRAFLDNNYVGMAIFAGIALDYALAPVG